MPGSVIAAIIIQGLLGCLCLYIATEMTGFLMIWFLVAGVAQLGLAGGLAAGQTWARIASMVVMGILVFLFFIVGGIFFGATPLITFACLYGQNATDYFRFKATGELPRTSRARRR